MSNFLTKIILQGLQEKVLIDYLNKISRKTYVSPSINNFIIIYDEKSEYQSQELFNLTSRLSHEFKCPALAILVHDDIVLHYELYQDGKLIDDYISNPGFHNSEKGHFPEGGDAGKLCNTFGVNQAINKVRSVLREPGETNSYFLASSRLAELVRELEIPAFWATDCVGGYQDIEQGNITPIKKDDPSPEATLLMLTKTGQNSPINPGNSLKKKPYLKNLSIKNPAFIQLLTDLIDEQP